MVYWIYWMVVATLHSVKCILRHYWWPVSLMCFMTVRRRSNCWVLLVLSFSPILALWLGSQHHQCWLYLGPSINLLCGTKLNVVAPPRTRPTQRSKCGTKCVHLRFSPLNLHHGRRWTGNASYWRFFVGPLCGKWGRPHAYAKIGKSVRSDWIYGKD